MVTLNPDQPQTIPDSAPVRSPYPLNPVLLVFLVFPVLGLIAALAVGLSGSNSAAGSNQQPPAIAVTSDTLIGRNAPDFELTALDGATTRLTALRGKPTFLNFWATYCAPCRTEMPAFQALVDGKILGDAHVLTVNKGDSTAMITSFYKEINVSLPTVLDRTGNVSDLYRVVNLPVTYIIDKNGVIIDRQLGIMNADMIIAYLDKLDRLGKTPTAPAVITPIKPG